MKARYLRLTLMPKKVDSDIEFSGFKLFQRGNQVSISVAVVRLNFTPVSGTVDIVKRDTIVEGEALVIPASLTRGNSYIYLDLGADTVFDAFQIGFGSTDKKSATKIRLDISNDGINYNTWEEISHQLKLKFRTPWTFSGISDRPTSGFPGFMMKPFYYSFYQDPYDIYNKNSECIYMPSFIGEDLRSFYGKRTSDAVLTTVGSINTTLGSNHFIPLSCFLDRGKYYFEISSKYGLNQYGGNSMSLMGIIHDENGAGYGFLKQAFVLNTNSLWSGVGGNIGQVSTSNNNIPPNSPIMDIPGGKKGFICGFSIDTVTGIIKVVNPSYGFEFQYNGNGLVNYFTSKPLAANPKINFFLSTDWAPNGTDCDLQFNFGQEPFKGPVPTGFDDRIGQYWEMELDPEYNFDLNITYPPNTDYDRWNDELPEAERKPASMLAINDVVSQGPVDYYIKGKVSDVNGKFPKRFVRLLGYPELDHRYQTSSSTIDGTYEFINIPNGLYAIVSQDSNSGEFSDEIIAPIRASKMDPTK